jgi:hypothetical protein
MADGPHASRRASLVRSLSLNMSPSPTNDRRVRRCRLRWPHRHGGVWLDGSQRSGSASPISRPRGTTHHQANGNDEDGTRHAATSHIMARSGPEEIPTDECQLLGQPASETLADSLPRANTASEREPGSAFGVSCLECPVGGSDPLPLTLRFLNGETNAFPRSIAY